MRNSLLFAADSGLPQNSGDLAFTVIDPEIKRLQGMLSEINSGPGEKCAGAIALRIAYYDNDA